MSYPFPWGPPPPGYIPGLGRGAVGFIDRIESQKVDIDNDIKSPKLAEKIRKENQKADEFYEEVDKKMKERNKNHKKKLNSDIVDNKTVFDEIHENFADLTKGLKSVSASEWANLPDIGTTTYHRQKWELYTHASDRMITGDFDDSALSKLANNDFDLENDEDRKIMLVSRAQKNVLNIQLSKVVGKQDSINVSNFMNELDQQAAEIMKQFDDLDRAAQLYRSLTHANKENPQSWLLRARVEEKRGQLAKARKVAKDGLLYCPNSELLVMENARLSPRNDAISLLKSALKVNHKNSEKIWLQLVAYQTNLILKKLTLENALEAIPQSENLWLAAAALEENEKHIDMLKKALIQIPKSKKIYVEGCRTSTNLEDAMYFVENGLKEIGDFPELVINWSQIEEKYNNSEKCDEICKKILNCLNENKDEDWISDAENSEVSGFPRTSICLINAIPFKDTFLIEASACQRRNHLTTARALFLRYASEKNDFIPFLKFEKDYGNIEEALKLAIKLNQDNEKVIVDISEFVSCEQAIQIIKEAYSRFPHSEILATKLVDLYIDSHLIDKAREFATSILDLIDTPNFYIKLAYINEQIGGDIEFLKKAVQRFPNEPKLWILYSKHSDDPISDIKNAIIKCPNSSELYIRLIKLLKEKGEPRPIIRAIFERAMDYCKRQSIIWLYASEFEDPSNRISILEKAKEYCKDDIGLIWAREIELSEQENRLTFAKETIEKTGNLKEIVLLIAISYWRNGNIDQAKTVFDNLNRENPNWGDGWIFRVKFDKTYCSNDELSTTLKFISSLKITDGFLWHNFKNLTINFKENQVDFINNVVDHIPDPMTEESSIFADFLKL